MRFDYVVLIILVVDFILSIIYSVRIVLGKTHLRNENIPVILFIPIFGILSAFWIEHLIKVNKHGDKVIETLPLVLEDDILWSSIRSEYESNDLIPLEEALMINDHKIRRDMMLNALYDDPEKYLDILRIATHNDDVETAHYATTTISHLQRNYQLELQKASVAHEEDPENLENLNKYLELTEKYINSDLLEEYLLKNQRIAFSKALDRKMALVGDDKETIIKQLRNRIELKDYMAAFELSNRLISLWPEDEEVWIEAVRVSVEGKDSHKLKETLDEMNAANIDWTKAGKERVEVWQG